MDANIPQETIDKLTEQIIAKIIPALKGRVTQAVNSAFASHQATRTVTLPLNPNPKPLPYPDVGAAQWIWTDEEPFEPLEDGDRIFRKAVAFPESQYVDSMLIDITGYSFYTLRVNGYYIATYGREDVQRYSIKLPKTNRVVITVVVPYGNVRLGPFGLIASAVMSDSTNYTGHTFDVVTDASWASLPRFSFDVNDGCTMPGYRPDSRWTRSRVMGPYGMMPWGALPKPTDMSTGHESRLGMANLPSALLVQGPLEPETSDRSISPDGLALLDGTGCIWG